MRNSSRFLIALFLVSLGTGFAAPSEVQFSAGGILQVNRKPFYPLGIYTYGVSAKVAQELSEKGFNTVACGFSPAEVPNLEQQGLMMLCVSEKERVDKLTSSPALLAWYLADEPEGHGQTSATLRAEYQKLKGRDPNHPIGLCHFLYAAFADFKRVSDFVMSDVYPVTAQRDVPLHNVGIHLDQAHGVNGGDYPVWGVIQAFGGPETDGGKWAVPTPQEVKCMAYIALVHRSTGLLFFSYWPQAHEMWASLGPLNREIQSIVPWLVSPECRDSGVSGKNPAIEARARIYPGGGVLMLVNTERSPQQTTLTLQAAAGRMLRDAAGSAGSVEVSTSGTCVLSFAPIEVKLLTWGAMPKVELFDPKQGEAAQLRRSVTNAPGM